MGKEGNVVGFWWKGGGGGVLVDAAERDAGVGDLVDRSRVAGRGLDADAVVGLGDC